MYTVIASSSCQTLKLVFTKCNGTFLFSNLIYPSLISTVIFVNRFKVKFKKKPVSLFWSVVCQYIKTVLLWFSGILQNTLHTLLAETWGPLLHSKCFNCEFCGNEKSVKLILFYFAATKQGADQYILNTQNMVWTAARDYCRTHYTDLTSLRNDAEYQIVQQVANGNEVYVGLFRDPWEWSDQTDSSFRYWNPDKTVWTDSTQTCVAMLKVNSGKWGDRACTETHPFVCDCSE